MHHNQSLDHTSVCADAVGAKRLVAVNPEQVGLAGASIKRESVIDAG
jgi:hypothetical protein